MQIQAIQTKTGIGDLVSTLPSQGPGLRPLTSAAGQAKLDPLVEALGKAARQETARTRGLTAPWR